MNKEIKFLAINNIEFDTPLSSKKAFKKYKKERKKISEEFWNKFVEKFDLVEFGSPIGAINNVFSIGTFLAHKLANGDKNDNK
jgi:hypothetical protein